MPSGHVGGDSRGKSQVNLESSQQCEMSFATQDNPEATENPAQVLSEDVNVTASCRFVGLTFSTGAVATAEGTGWSIVTKRALNVDNITMMDIWIIMFLIFIGISLLIWYFSQVVPWVASNPKPVYFPLKPSYWCPVPVESVATQIPPDDPGAEVYFESPPEGAIVAIKLQQVTKTFGPTTALDCVDLEIYKGQTTVLLGHNGAAKTTMMHIITGCERC